MLIDTHCHPFLQEKKQFSDTFKNFKDNHGNYLISVGTNLEDSNISVKLSKKYDFIYSTIGIHPNNTTVMNGLKPFITDIIKELKQLYLENSEKIVGIGECGYDYFHINKNNLTQEKENQRILFEAQIQLAKELGLPVIIHSRNAFDDTLNTLKQMNYKKFLIHSFSENLDMAKKYLDFSPECMIGFNGIVTFKNALEIQNTAKNIPLKNIVIETDSPYLTPTPFRGKEENEPAYVQYILDKIIELRNEDEKEIERTIYENSLSFFGIK